MPLEVCLTASPVRVGFKEEGVAVLAEDGDREDGEPRHALESKIERYGRPEWRAERVESEIKLSERAKESSRT